jgi:hypothetical protein
MLSTEHHAAGLSLGRDLPQQRADDQPMERHDDRQIGFAEQIVR